MQQPHGVPLKVKGTAHRQRHTRTGRQQQTVAQPSALLIIIHGIEQKVKHPVSACTPQGKQHRVVQSDGGERPGVGARVRKVHIP